MLTNFLSKLFNLISKTKLIDGMCIIMYELENDRDILKAKYDHKAITEWSFYKHLWHLRGKLSMLEEIIDKLGE